MARTTTVALLTGGSDKPYAVGLATALAANDVGVEFVGSNELDCPEVNGAPHITFLNLRGDQREDVPLTAKIRRIAAYYARLVRYVATAQPRVLHILWNNKFELFDRTLLMAYYRMAGKRVVLTAHNINTAARDGRDTAVNRWSLRMQYRLCDHVFVHTDAMKQQLVARYGMRDERVSVVPFGINDTIPRSDLSQADARQSLGLAVGDRTLLFFGQIAPYKGLEYLVQAVAALARSGERYRLVIAGKVKRGHEEYWATIRQSIAGLGIADLVLQRIQFIPDDQVEPYFKAADVVVIPYVDIFQSGVPFLAFSFGIPVIATDVGSLRADVTADTGILCRPRDPSDLARAIGSFYQSDLYRDRERVRGRIRRFADEQHSWQTVAERTKAVYQTLADKGDATALVASKCPE